VFVRNGKNRTCNEFIPISVSDDPKILDINIDIVISPEDMYDIRNFIIINKNLLVKMSKGKLLPDDFINDLKVPSLELEEGYFIINEMATVSTQLTNLPMTIWVDEGATFQGHTPRIKFKASKEQRNTREFSSMTLTKPPKIENLPQRNDLSKRDIEKLEKFVLDNFENLLKLAKGEIDYREDFLPQMVKCTD
ncbi:MAG: hypothetical protein K2M09_06110, partial [Muribaculaceae bacterium]|nr:hypothetical protein [Muribaculaceae bacterium]